MEKQNEAIKLQFERMEQRLPTTEFCENIQRFVQETSSKCAELYAMCLKDREDIDRIEKNLAVVYKQINTNKEHRIRVERTTTDLSTSVTTNAEHITQIHAEIAKLHNDINTINSTCSDNKKQLYVEITKARHHPELSRQGGPSADEIAEIKQQIQNIAKGLETVSAANNNNNNTSADSSPRRSTPQHKERIYSDKSITSPNVLLVDSNGRKIDENRISDDSGFTCDKLYTPTWGDISKMVDEIQCEDPNMVEKIFIHVGTNDFDHGDAVMVCTLMEEGIGRLKQKFPRAALTLCTIIPRKSGNKNEDIRLVNQFLTKSHQRLAVGIINLERVKSTMFYDEKHLNGEGLRILINATIFTFTGLFPAVNFPKRQQRGGYGRNNYGGGGPGNGKGKFRRYNNNNRHNNNNNNNNNNRRNYSGRTNGDSEDED